MVLNRIPGSEDLSVAETVSKAVNVNRWAFLAVNWILQAALALFFSRTILRDIAPGTTLLEAGYVFGSIVLWHLMVGLLPMLLSALIAVKLNDVALGIIASLLWAPLVTFLRANATVYDMYGYHIDGMVLNLLLNPAAGDSVKLGSGTALGAVLHLLWAGVVSALFSWGCWWWARWKGRAVQCFIRRRVVVLTLILLAAFAVEKSIYVVGVQVGATKLTQVRQLLGPLYPAATARRLLHRRFGIAPRESGVSSITGTLAYPPKDLELDTPPDPLPDIIIIVVESAHAGGNDPEVMPHTVAFAQDHLRSELHLSGGNSSRHSIFTLMYGLYPTYWPAFEGSRSEPYLMTRLRELDYRKLIVSSTDLNFPEFRQTVFSMTDPAVIFDRWPKELDAVERDRLGTDLVLEFLAESGEQPNFVWLYLDSPHFYYRFDEAYFLPVLEPKEADVIAISRRKDPARLQALRNRSLNSLRYVDKQIGRILEQLESTERGRNTAVIIVGDHGEGFGEYGEGRGHLMHNGASSPAQLATTFAARIPGIKERTVLRGPTSHFDVSATLLPLLGAGREVTRLTQGRNWAEQQPAEWIMCANWSEAALTDGREVVRFGLAAHNMGILEVRDWNYVLLDDQKEALDRWRPYISEAMQERGRFFRERARPRREESSR